MTDGKRGKSLLRRIAPPRVSQLVMHAVLVGIVAGLGALAFSLALEYSSDFMISQVCGVELPREGKHVLEAAEEYPGGSLPRSPEEEPASTYDFQTPPWNKRIWILFVPTIGGLLCGLLVFTFAPEAEGHGTDSVIDAFHNKRGVIRRRIPFIKIIASVLTIATGGNAGREGPIAQVSAGFGSFLGDVFKLSARRRRILVVAGVGAGVGAMFRCPLGGALFAVDVLYRDTEFEYEALIPAFIASIVGYTTFAWLTPAGMGAIFAIPENLTLNSPVQLLLCVLLVPLLAVAGVVYVKVFYGTTALFRNKLPVKPHFKPMIGGLILGAVALAEPRLLTTGYGWVQQAIDGHLTIGFMLVLVVAKIVLTGVTIGSGGSGGVFGPSVVIGGLLGGAFGSFVQIWIPDVQPAAFVLLGMAGFFAAAAKVPISTIIMVSEMTVGYSLLLPLMLVCSLTYLVSPQRISIYIKQVARRIDSPAHLGDFVVDILERLRVSDVFSRSTEDEEFVSTAEDLSLQPLLERVSQTPHTVFPVLDKDGLMTGVIRLDDLRGAFLHPELAPLIIANDIAFHRYEPLLPTDNLNMALRKMSESRCAELPVIADPESRQVLGMLSRHELLQAYSAQMEELMRGNALPA